MAKGDPTLYNGYLGGHNWITHTDKGALEYIKNKFDIKTMLDVGCGPGGQIKVAKRLGISAEGVDGDPRVVDENKTLKIHLCDYTKTPFVPEKEYDLIWSTEFVEHVRETFVDNYMQTFKSGKFAFITYAPEGKPGNHHVNCKNQEYWENVFKKYGFVFDEETSMEIRENSTMKREFVRNTGMFFQRR